jgi:hypothetical protein
LVATFDTPGVAEGLELNGGVAYLVDSSSLWVIDVSAPTHPVAIGHLAIEDPRVHAELDGNIVYVADDSHGLHVIDVTDPTAPVELAAFAWPDATGSTVAAGGLVYVTSWYEGVVAVRFGPEHQPGEATP